MTFGVAVFQYKEYASSAVRSGAAVAWDEILAPGSFWELASPAESALP